MPLILTNISGLGSFKVTNSANQGSFSVSLSSSSSGSLYPFTNFTFTTVGASGSAGPTFSQMVNAYSSSASWVSNASYFTSSLQGFQVWTVPTTGNYQFQLAGARSGMGTGAYSGSTSQYTGSGAIIQATLPLTQGQKLVMVVGQVNDSTGSQQSTYATYLGYGGGGGTFVALSGSTITPLLVAGGAGGAGHYQSFNGGAYYPGHNGVTTTYGGTSTFGAVGGSNGLGGYSHSSGSSHVAGTNTYDGGGGGGFYGYGYDGAGVLNSGSITTFQGTGGWSFVSGAIGGSPATNYVTYAGSGGGFGCGGGGNGIINGGGGGGYSGGGGTYGAVGPSSDAGGGGGSYIYTTATSVATSDGKYDTLTMFSGSAITNLASYNSGSGYIKVTFIG